MARVSGRGPPGARTLLDGGGRTGGMLHDAVTDPGELTVAELHDRYVTKVRNVIDSHGVRTVVESTDVDPATIEALAAGETPELTVEEASDILAVPEGSPDPDTVATLAREELLMGMTTAVLDVEAVESGIEGELEAREIQSKVEGRFPMTLREFALLSQFIDGRR